MFMTRKSNIAASRAAVHLRKSAAASCRSVSGAGLSGSSPKFDNFVEPVRSSCPLCGFSGSSGTEQPFRRETFRHYPWYFPMFSFFHPLKPDRTISLFQGSPFSW
jgi:hypothetical protein